MERPEDETVETPVEDEADRTFTTLRYPDERRIRVHFFDTEDREVAMMQKRRMAYIQPRIEENQFGGESVTYMGLDARKHWTRVESYGPKFVENITQALCRDLWAVNRRGL